MFTKGQLKRLNRMSPAAKKSGLASQMNVVRGAHTVTAADATAGKVTLTISGFTATGMLAHMVSDEFAPVDLTVEKFAAASGNTALEFDTTTLTAGQIIYYLLW